MLRLMIAGVGLSLGLSSAVLAQSCSTYPNTLANGTTADANQVMANFNCAALTGSGRFTGNVGIDTTTPADTLDIDGQVVLGPGTERMSFNSGSLGFNRRVVNGQIYNSGVYAYQFQHTGSGTNTSDFLALQVYTPAGSAVTSSALAVNGAGNVSVGTVQSTYEFYVNGTAAGTGNWINASDARLKTNVTQITDALGLVERLRGVRFRWRPAEQREVGKTLALPVSEPQMGFIAQEVEGVVPEAVVAPKKGSGEVYGLKEAGLLPLLVEAVKEQQVEIEQLRAELAASKASK